MRCHICNASIRSPQWDHDHGDWAPCFTCQLEINDVLDSYKDIPFLGDGDAWMSHLGTETTEIPREDGEDQDNEVS